MGTVALLLQLTLAGDVGCEHTCTGTGLRLLNERPPSIVEPVKAAPSTRPDTEKCEGK